MASDAKFKLWEGLPAAGGSASASPLPAGSALGGWACRSVGYYRQSAASAAAFSTDGSLLAVAYAPNLVTMWDPLSCRLLKTLAEPLAGDAADAIHFVAFPGQGATLVAASRRSFLCWSVLSTELLWSYRTDEVVAAAADPRSDAVFLAVTVAAAESMPPGTPPSYALLEFAPDATAGTPAGATAPATAPATAGGTPRRAWRLHCGRPKTVAFLPSARAGRASAPLCLSENGDLFTMPVYGHEPTEPVAQNAENGKKMRISLRKHVPGKLTAIFGPTTLALDESDASTAVAPHLGAVGTGSSSQTPDTSVEGWEGRRIDEWLKANIASVPSHLLPPLEAICPHVLHRVMRPATHLVDGATPRCELEKALRAEAASRGEKESDALGKAVDVWAPRLRKGFLGGKRAKRKAVAAAAPAVDDEFELLASASAGGVSDTLAEETLLRAADEGEVFVPGGALGDMSREKHAQRKEAADGPGGHRVQGANAAVDGTDTTAEVAEAGGEGKSVGAWPPKGWALLDMCGCPNPGILVREVDCTRATGRWSAADDEPPPTGLSAADLAFVEENKFDDDTMDELTSWFREGGCLGESPTEPLDDLLAGLPWHPEDEEPEEIAERIRASGVLKGIRLPPASGKGGAPTSRAEAAAGVDLETELAEAQQALARAGLRADERLGFGIASAPMPPEMRQPPTPGWQSEPTKAELKSVAKEYRRRRAQGEEPEELAVLKAGILASRSAAARRIVLEADQ